MNSSVRLLMAVSVAAIGLAQQPPRPNQTDGVSKIIVDRRGCFGGCPIYTLVLQRQGVSTYAGITGLWRGLYAAKQVSLVDFDRLTNAVSEARFFNLPALVGRAIVDAEQVTVTVTSARASNTVTTFELEQSPIAPVVKLADALADQLPWENLNLPRNGVTRPFPLRQVRPEYTEEARKAGLQGSVIVQLEVRPDGTVAPETIAIVQGLGVGLDEKAVEAVKQWIFKPAYQGDKPLGITATAYVHLVFHL